MVALMRLGFSLPQLELLKQELGDPMKSMILAPNSETGSGRVHLSVVQDNLPAGLRRNSVRLPVRFRFIDARMCLPNSFDRDPRQYRLQRPA